MSDEAMEYSEYDGEDVEDYGPGEVDEMLEGLVDAGEDILAERSKKRRRRQKRGGGPAAQGGSAYRSPGNGAYVTQTQLKEALARVGTDIKRNGDGIKTLNTRFTGLNSRVDDVVVVNKVQSKELGKLGKQMKIDGALELAEAITFPAAGGAELDPYRVLRGAVKSGMLGDAKGALGNPLLIGGGGLVLRYLTR